MLMSLVCLCVFLSLWCGSLASPLVVVSSRGAVKPVSLLRTQLGAMLPDGEKKALVSVLDCCSSLEDKCEFVNSLFGSKFEFAENGLSVDATADSLVVRSSFESMFSKEFCGAKAAAFSSSMPCGSVLLITSDDIDESLSNYDQLLRRFLLDLPVERPLVLIVQVAQSADKDSISSKVLSTLKSIAAELEIDRSWTRVHVIAMPLKPTPSELSVAKLAIHPAESSLVDADDAASLLTRNWDAVPKLMKPVLSKAEEEALFGVEVAYAEVLRSAQEAVHSMQQRVSSGRPLIHFPDRMNQLLTSCLTAFQQQTSSALALRERTERAEMLRNFVASSAQLLFDQQMLLIEYKTVQQVKKDLVALHKKSAEVSSDALQALIRKTVFDHKTEVNGFEITGFACVYSDKKLAELTSRVESIVNDFAESPEAKLLELQHVSRQVQKQSGKKKNARGSGSEGRKLLDVVRMGVSIVGMLRPHGFGNLQGIVSYATSLFGLPLDFLLGVHNDGDTLEVMGEDREHPLLRLQPKFNFEIDL